MEEKKTSMLLDERIRLKLYNWGKKRNLLGGFTEESRGECSAHTYGRKEKKKYKGRNAHLFGERGKEEEGRQRVERRTKGLVTCFKG